jgi:phosphatidylserine decarboxylase
VNTLTGLFAGESVQGKDIYFRICLFYFVFNQKAVRDLQSPIAPGSSSQELTTLSKWLVKYANALGAFLDTPESITDDALKSFRESPNYNMKEYIVPPRVSRPSMTFSPATLNLVSDLSQLFRT